MNIVDALCHTYRTIDGRTGSSLVGGSDADLLALLQLAGDEVADPIDRMYAEIIVTDPAIRMVVEQARLRHAGTWHGDVVCSECVEGG